MHFWQTGKWWRNSSTSTKKMFKVQSDLCFLKSIHVLWGKRWHNLRESLKGYYHVIKSCWGCIFFQGVPSSPSLPASHSDKKQPPPPLDESSDEAVRTALLSQLGKLMTTNLVVRLNNFAMWKVSTSNAKSAPKEFISGKSHLSNITFSSLKGCSSF